MNTVIGIAQYLIDPAQLAAAQQLILVAKDTAGVTATREMALAIELTKIVNAYRLLSLLPSSPRPVVFCKLPASSPKSSNF